MKKLFLLIIIFFNFSCMKDTFIVNPRSIKEAKERNAFIKEFMGDGSVISFEGNEYLINEVYLTYGIDSKKVHEQAVSLVFKTINNKTQKFDCPDDYTKFEIIIDTIKYDLGERTHSLESTIPTSTSDFVLVYYDNKIKKIINFKEK